MSIRFKPLSEAAVRARWQMFVRPMPGVYVERSLPDGDDADAVILASELAAEHRQQICLVLLDRWSLWFDEEGEIFEITPRSRTKASPPYMTSEDDPRPFVFKAASRAR